MNNLECIEKRIEDLEYEVKDLKKVIHTLINTVSLLTGNISSINTMVEDNILDLKERFTKVEKMVLYQPFGKKVS